MSLKSEDIIIKVSICKPFTPWRLLIVIIFAMATSFGKVGAQTATNDQQGGEIRIIEVQGTVELMPAGAQTWVLTQTNQILHPFDRLRTGANSRVTMLWCDHSVVPFGALGEIEILAPDSGDFLSGMNFLRGIASFFHRDKPGRIHILTHGATASIEGTEFVIEVSGTMGNEEARFSVIDGKVSLTNQLGTLLLTNGQQGAVQLAKAPFKTSGFIANNLLQWCFYYPGVLDLADLSLSQAEQKSLEKSLAAYRSGDLLGALANFTKLTATGSDNFCIYHAALLLSVGQVKQTESELDLISAKHPTDRVQHLINGLRTLIASVKRQPKPTSTGLALPTELLAASYYEQSLGEGDKSLQAALNLARRAASNSPSFSFAWSRVAELEFGFGHTESALSALNISLKLAPRNAQSEALAGFQLAAKNNIPEAMFWFNRALSDDSALGNAWLGRGLCRIREGDLAGGRADLLVAAAMEPQRAALRSYLGKAFTDAGDTVRAQRELYLARKLDPNDPTSWLYSALLDQQECRINQAIRDLEKSEELNDNRSVYRSRMMLDEDAAVRGANLAGIYRDAGMDAVSVREATRAVNYDYANYSAHLFLANSYNQLRDPDQINLRYETPWYSEYLLANLLAPVGAGTLSQNVSEQEYSKLFQHDGFGGASSTEYTSRGDWTQSASEYATFGNFGLAVDTDYRSGNGQQPNNSQQQLTIDAKIKWDATTRDSFFLQTTYYNANAGDLDQYYNTQSANRSIHTTEIQDPLLLLGYRHQWSPGVETLAVIGRFNDTQTVTNSNQPVLLLARDGAGEVIALPTPALPTAPFFYQNALELYSAEVQQIWQQDENTLIIGGRSQYATFNTQNSLGASTPTLLASMTQTTMVGFATSPINQSISPDFERLTGYAYDNWRIFDPLQFEAGVSYDHMVFPQNFRFSPISTGEQSESQVSPKVGLTLTPLKDNVVRFAYTRSLGGVSFDQSVRLEPSQMAGFNQAYRSIIPEAVVGSASGAKFETYGLSLEQKFKCGTYLGVEADILKSSVNQTIGEVNLDFPPSYIQSRTQQNLDYMEDDLTVTANQLLGDHWSIGASDQLSRSQLGVEYPEIPSTVSNTDHTKNSALLNQINLFILFNHPSGFFARAEADRYSQSNSGYTPALAGADFWQFNLFGGYRFFHRHAQIQFGLLNLAGQNYRLNPLNIYTQLPRQRTFTVSLKFYF